MFSIFTNRIGFELCLTEKKKKEEERKKINKSEIFMFGFLSSLLKVSEVFRVDLAIE